MEDEDGCDDSAVRALGGTGDAELPLPKEWSYAA